MSLYHSMQELIGNTPLVELTNSGFPEGVNVYAVLELFDPSGSVKDRTGKYMIEDARQRGVLGPGGTIVEGTAGNTGLGIAFSALGQGYNIKFVVPDKFSDEKKTLMKALGAEIISSPRSEGMLGAEKRARELKDSIDGAVTLDQFKNPANPRAHYETTGPEIYKDLDGKVDYLVAGAGSGGTFTGVVRFLKEQNSNIKGILADPIGSTIGGGEHGDYSIEGIGNDFIAETMDITLVDEAIKVSDSEAFEGSRFLARHEGIIAGSSSGAAFAAVRKLVSSGAKGNIVVIFPDRGDRYFSKALYQ